MTNVDTADPTTSRRPSRPILALVIGVVVAIAAITTWAVVSDDPPGGATNRQAAVAPTSNGGSQVASLEQRVAAEPDDVRSWQALGTAYVGRAAEVGDPSFYDLAERAFDRADELVADDPSTLIGRGALALSLHEFEEAETLGEQAVEALPNSNEALGILVDAQVELGRYTEAVDTLEQMLEQRPGLPALSRASYLRELYGDLTGAIEAMQQAEQAGAGSRSAQAQATSLLGHLYLLGGDLDAAEAAYERAADASPDLVAAQVGRAKVLAARGDDAGAVAILEEVTERFPEPAALALLGALHESLGDAEGTAEAHSLVRTIARLQEDAGQLVDLEMAVFEADLGDDPARAVELARAAHEARPDNVYAADALAWALFRSGDAAGALPHVETALRLGSIDPVVRYHAAEVFAATGDDTRAAESLAIAFAGRRRFSVRHEAQAVALAERLGVELPPAAAS